MRVKSLQQWRRLYPSWVELCMRLSFWLQVFKIKSSFGIKRNVQLWKQLLLNYGFLTVDVMDEKRRKNQIKFNFRFPPHSISNRWSNVATLYLASETPWRWFGPFNWPQAEISDFMFQNRTETGENTVWDLLFQCTLAKLP